MVLSPNLPQDRLENIIIVESCYEVTLRKESCLAESGFPSLALSRVQDEVELLSVPKNADDLWFNKVSYITIFYFGRKGKTPKQKNVKSHISI